MADYSLMEAKDGERMNVPSKKVDEFIENGWKVIEIVPETVMPATVQTPEGEATPEEAVEKVAKKHTKKGAKEE